MQGCLRGCWNEFPLWSKFCGFNLPSLAEKTYIAIYYNRSCLWTDYLVSLQLCLPLPLQDPIRILVQAMYWLILEAWKWRCTCALHKWRRIFCVRFFPLFFPYLSAHSWRSPFLEVHTQVTNLWGLDGKDFSVLLGGRERFFALSEWKRVFHPS